MLELGTCNHDAATVTEALGISEEDWDKAFHNLNKALIQLGKPSEAIEYIVKSVDNDSQLIAAITILYTNVQSNNVCDHL